MKPIIFDPESIAAIIRGDKTQSRRVIKRACCRGPKRAHREHLWDKAWVDDGGTIFGPGPYLKLPFIWDQLGEDEGAERIHCPYGYPEEKAKLWVRERWTANGQPRSPMFMPRILARLFLTITAVRCERLREISEVDARAEGCASREGFQKRWDHLNAKRGFPWTMNPLVWVLEFEIAKLKADTGPVTREVEELEP